MTDLPPLLSRIKLRGKHPWKGCTGTVIAHEVLGMCPELGPRPRVRLDEADAVPYGHECFIVNLEEAVRLKR